MALRFLSFGWSFFFRQSGKHTKFSNVVEFLVFIPDGLKPLHLCILLKSFEPSHDKTNKMACAPSEDSDQPGNQPSLIRVFAVRMKKAWALSYPVSAERRLIRLGGCPGWSESSLGADSFLGFCPDAAHLLNVAIAISSDPFNNTAYTKLLIKWI